MLESSPCTLLTTQDVSQSAYTIDHGVYADDTLPEPINTNPKRYGRVYTLGSVDGVRHRGCIIRPLIDEAAGDNAVVNARVLTMRPIVPRGSHTHSGWIIEHIGDLVMTASTALVAKSIYHDTDTDGHIAGNYRLADTIDFTPTDLGAALFAAYDPAPSVHSPEDNTQAMLMMPDLAGAHGLIIDPIDDTAINGLVEVMT